MPMDMNLNNSAFDDIINDPSVAEMPEGMSVEDTVEDVTDQHSDKPDETIETFDNLDTTQGQLKNIEDQEEKIGEDEDKDAAKEESESKEDESKPDGKDGGKEEETPAKEEKEEEEKPKFEGKTFKLFKDGQKIEVPMDATIRTKVNGKNEIVTIEELRNNYSGKQAWDKKMPELAEKERIIEAKNAELTRVQQTLRSNLEGTRSDLIKALEENGNPLDAMNKIVDMLGVDSYDFNKAVFSSMLDQLSELQQMDEAEQEAFWLRKQNAHINSKHESLAEQNKQAKAREERIASIDRMREARGVSEEDFVSAYKELSQQAENVTPEQAIEYAVNLPLLQTAEECLKPYEDQLSDDEFDSMMAKVAQAMKNDRSITKDDVVMYLAEVYQVEDLVNTVNRKADKMEAGKDETKQAAKAISQHDLYSNPSYESFDDLVG